MYLAIEKQHLGGGAIGQCGRRPEGRGCMRRAKGAGGRPGHVFIAGFLFLRWFMPDAFCPVYNPDCAGAVCLKSPKLLPL